MKTRLISAFVTLIVFIPIFIIGGLLFKIVVFGVSILALKEFMDIKEAKHKTPDFIKFISYITLTLIVLGRTKYNIESLSIDFRIIAELFLALLIPVVLYHGKETYDVNDAFYLIGGLFFIGFAFNLLVVLREYNLGVLIYLFLITIMTDTYAYITGLLIGKNKLIPYISPKKTWEGMIGGTIFGVLFSTVFYIVVINPNVSIVGIIIVSTFLSILGQLGDLVFSSIKRYYGKKDFSNIMPGHGGVLDRLDSIIFVMLGFMFFISIL